MTVKDGAKAVIVLRHSIVNRVAGLLDERKWLTTSRNKSISMDLIGLNDMVLVGH
jgi:hypothetical protein